MPNVNRYFAVLLFIGTACGSAPSGIEADAQVAVDAAFADAQPEVDAALPSQEAQFSVWGNPGREWVLDLSTDTASRVFLTGVYDGSISFGTVNHQTNHLGNREIWAASLSADGTPLWSVAIHKTFETLHDRVYSIVPDGEGGAWILANLFGSAEIAGSTITIASDKRRLVLLHLDEEGSLESHIESHEMGTNIGGSSHQLIRSGDTLYLASYLIGEGLSSEFQFAGRTFDRHGSYLMAIDTTAGQASWHYRLEGYNEQIRELQMSPDGELLVIGVNDYDLNFGDLELTNTKSGQPYVLTVAPISGEPLDGWFVPSCESCRTFGEYLKSTMVGDDVALSYYEFGAGTNSPVISLFSKTGTLRWENRGDPQVVVNALAAAEDRVFAVGQTTIPANLGGENLTIAGPILAEIDVSTGVVSCVRTAPILDRDQSQVPVESIGGWPSIAISDNTAHVAGGMVGPLLMDGLSVPTEGLVDIVAAAYPIGAEGASICP